jgi:hypothetical protein
MQRRVNPISYFSTHPKRLALDQTRMTSLHVPTRNAADCLPPPSVRWGAPRHRRRLGAPSKQHAHLTGTGAGRSDKFVS